MDAAEKKAKKDLAAANAAVKLSLEEEIAALKDEIAALNRRLPRWPYTIAYTATVASIVIVLELYIIFIL